MPRLHTLKLKALNQICSMSQIARQLGVNIEMAKIARTFAEIETMLVR